MSERIIDGRPKLPAPEERLALPAPEGHEENRREEKPARRWYRRPRFWIILLIVALLALAAWWFFGRSKGGGEEEGGRPPAVVSVARATQAEWGEQLTAVGTVRAIQGVAVTSELAGAVAAIRFTNGTRTRAGATLVQLDTTTERAQLRSLIAQRNQARLAYDRALRLIQRGAIAVAEVELARASYESLAAQADQTRTLIEKKRIDAPFSGELGIRLVSLGQYIAPGTAVVGLQQLTPIFVNFELPESAFGRLRTGQRVQMRTDAFPGRSFTGRINAINPEIAQATRNVTVQAIVANGDRMLKPGMFADVTVVLPGTRRVTVVPASAVTANAYGESVYLVARPDPKRERQKAARRKQAEEEEEGGFFSKIFGGGSGGGDAEKNGGSDKGGSEKGGGQGGQQQPQYVARTAFIKTGERRGEFVEIVRGLKGGQPVVTAGQLKLEEDGPIQISRQNAQAGVRAQPNRP